MIKKERIVPSRIVKMESLLRRLPKNHLKRKEVEAEFAKRVAGFRGEQSIDYYLYRLIESKNHLIVNDIRLQSGTTIYFQIDVLILSKTHFLILELKNISGELIFDSNFKQVIRKYNGKEEVFQDPIIQVNRQEILLMEQLKKNNFPYIPIESLVVMTNASAILKSINDTDGYFNKVIRSATLSDRIKSFDEIYKREVITLKDLNRISEQIIKVHTPEYVDVLSLFKIDKEELIKGVLCPECIEVPMKSIYLKWHCPNCLHISKDAHFQALQDYKQLLGSRITNSQMKNFFLLDSDTACYRWLKKLNLPFTGNLKSRVYQL